MSGQLNIRSMKPAIEWQKIHQSINQLQNPELREEALKELVRKQFNTPDLAILLWENTATTFIFLQELIVPFSKIDPANITDQESERVCLTLQLLRIVVAHDETRLKFVRTKFFLYLYPYLNITWTTEPFVRARQMCLYILKSLVVHSDSEIFTLLLSTNLITLLTRVIGGCLGVARNNAIITLHRILVSNDGLAYIVGQQELVDAINLVLKGLFGKISSSPITAIIRRCLKRLNEKNI